MFNHIVIVGCGYVGLTTGIFLSQNATNRITFVDRDEDRMTSLRKGILPISEPGLHEHFDRNFDKFSFSNSVGDIDPNFDFIYVCVGTPSGRDGICLDHLSAAIADIIEILPKQSVRPQALVVRSTVLPGTTRRIYDDLKNSGITSEHLTLIYNPEFLREGSAFADMQSEGRNLYGTKDASSYREFEATISRPLVTDWETAEFSKYYSNIFYVSLMSFSNEMACIAELLPFNIDMKKVVQQHLLDRRFIPPSQDLQVTDQGSNLSSYLTPSFGYGGSCFPKDTVAFYKGAAALTGRESALLASFIKGNSETADARIEIIVKWLSELRVQRPAMLGLSFKPNTADVRNSPAVKFLTHIQAHFSDQKILVHDPMWDIIQSGSEKIFDQTYIKYLPLEALLAASDCLIITTAWEEYRDINPARYPNLKVVVDTKSLLNFKEIETLRELNIRYVCPGTRLTSDGV